MPDSSSEPTLAGSQPATASSSQLHIELGSTRVGRYLILEELGRGGMGVVYAALDPELDRRVAVKVLKRWEDGVAGSQGHKRLLREAQAMAKLKHRNVVTVYDAGIHESRMFMAFELVEGTTLTRWLETPRSVAEIVDVFVQAGRGLAAAHAKGLVHRDFKPDNVMIDLEEGRPVARVMDFGLARIAGAPRPVREPSASSSDAFSIDLTQDGRVVGTPRFMAPEQHLDSETDARSDQFAFCVALWEALYGQHPFGGETPTELVARVIAGARRTPSAEARVPPRMRRALERGLLAEPDARWPSLDALLDELAHDPSRRRRRVAIAVGVLGVIATGFVVERVLHAREVEDCRRRGLEIETVWNDAAREQLGEQTRASGIAHAEATFERLVPWLDGWAIRWQTHAEQACRAAEVDERWSESTAAKANACLDEHREVLVGMLEGLQQPDAATLGQAIAAAAELPRTEACVEERHLVLLPDPQGVEASHALRAQLARARGLTDVGRLDDATEVVERVLADADDSGLARVRIEATLLSGEVTKTRGDYEPALARYREAFASALEHDAPDLALDAVLGIMTTSGVSLVRADEALAWEEVARALLRRLGEERSVRAARLLHTLGLIRHKQSEYREAHELLTAALEIRREQVGDDHPALESTLDALASIEIDLGNYDRAGELASQLVDLKQRVHGPEHPAVASGLNTMGLVHDARRDHAAAEAVHRRALAIREAAYGSDHPLVATALSNVALSLYQRGENAGARPLLERALAIHEAAVGRDHPEIAAILTNLGNVQHNLGDFAAANESYTRALALARRKLGADHATVGVVLANLANTAANLGRIDDAVEHQRGALAILEQRYGAEHPTVANALMNLGQLHVMQERYDDALVPLLRALAILEASVGPDHPDVAYALLGIADARLGLGRRAEAQQDAARALAIRESKQVSPLDLANARFTLARALDDRTRARALAQQARTAFETADPGVVATVDAWLRDHAPG